MKYYCAIVLLVCGVMLLAREPRAQPIRDRILAGTHVIEEAGCTVVKVRLNFPVRYVSHFPSAYGDELRIRLRPITISSDDRDALFERESVRAPVNERAAIGKIIYEGDDVGGPILALLFRHPVAFKVGQGGDFRSLIIAISGEEASEACLPIFPS